MSSTFRCPGCKGRFNVNDAHRKVGLNYVCSSDCHTAIAHKANSKRPTPKPAARRRSPGSEIPPKTRAALWLRDGGCRFCGSRTADAHHINYKSEGIDHQLHNLILLCTEHHNLVHSSKKTWKPLLLAYVWVRMVEGRSTTIPALKRQGEH